MKYHLFDSKDRLCGYTEDLEVAETLVKMHGWTRCPGCEDGREEDLMTSLWNAIFQGETPRRRPYFDGPDIGSPNADAAPVVNEHGAKRGTDLAGIPYHMLSRHALRAYAKAMAEGSKKYGDWNWLRGFPISGLIDHAIEHLLQYTNGDRSENHLGHAFWNIATAIEFMNTRPDLDDIPTKEKRDGFASNKYQHKSQDGNTAASGSGVESPRTGSGFESIR